MTKKIVSLLLAVALVASFGFAGAATLTEKDITVKGGVDIYLEGSLMNPKDVTGSTVDTFIYNGTTYLPIRAISEAFGLDVDFDLGTGSVYLNGVAGNVEKSAEYLEHFFGVKFSGTVTLADWNKAIEAVGGTAVEGETLTVGDAIVSAVKTAKLEELALAYDAEKTPARLAAYGVPFEVSEELAQYFVCALDADLIPANTNPTADLTAALAEELLMGVVQLTGQGRNYIGRVSDADIATKLNGAFNQITTLADEEGVLAELGPEIAYRGATTGYGLKYTGYNANFLPEYTITYGHSDLKHAVQLIALLDSEGIDAYLQLEPKTSIYFWDGGYSVGNEYDLQIEFDNLEDKFAFDELAKTYCKRSSEHNKISGNWVTPLYSSTTPIDENYEIGYDNVIKNGNYEIHSFSTESGIEKVAAVVKDVAPEVEVTVVPRYINVAFVVDYLPDGDANN